MKKEEYIFGSKQEELKRLGFQHKVWAEEALASWQKAGLQSNHKVLDIGSGPGFASTDLAYISEKVYAIEKSSIFCKYLDKTCTDQNISNIEIINSDLEDFTIPEKIDLAYSRWVFSWLEKPELALRNIDKVLKSGSKMIFQEYCYWGALNMEPSSDEFKKFYKAARKSFDREVGNVDIGYKIPEMLKKLEYEIISLTPMTKIGRPKTKVWNWISTFADIYGKLLVERELFEESDRISFLNKIKELESDDSAYYSTPQMIEIIAQKK